MRARRLATDVRRCAAAAGPPLLALAVITLLAITLLAQPAANREVGEGLRTGALTLAAVPLVWLLARLGMALVEPRRDRAAAEHLQLLRDGAATPGCVLVQVASITWAGPAGQRCLCVDVLTGATPDLWIPETRLPLGAFALVRLDGYVAHPVDTAGVSEVDAAHRHERRQPAVTGADVAAAAERLLST